MLIFYFTSSLYSRFIRFIIYFLWVKLFFYPHKHSKATPVSGTSSEKTTLDLSVRRRTTGPSWSPPVNWVQGIWNDLVCLWSPVQTSVHGSLSPSSLDLFHDTTPTPWKTETYNPFVCSNKNKYRNLRTLLRATKTSKKPLNENVFFNGYQSLRDRDGGDGGGFTPKKTLWRVRSFPLVYSQIMGRHYDWKSLVLTGLFTCIFILNLCILILKNSVIHDVYLNLNIWSSLDPNSNIDSL